MSLAKIDAKDMLHTLRGFGNPTEPGRRLQGRYLTELVDSVVRYLSMVKALTQACSDRSDFWSRRALGGSPVVTRL